MVELSSFHYSNPDFPISNIQIRVGFLTPIKEREGLQVPDSIEKKIQESVARKMKVEN